MSSPRFIRTFSMTDRQQHSYPLNCANLRSVSLLGFR